MSHAEAACLRRSACCAVRSAGRGSGRQAKLDAAIAANLPVRRSPQGEGGKELGYGG